MIERCFQTTSPKYKNWGGRGITVCERWLDFRNFLADMGERPAGKTLDRIDNDNGYFAANCRWATTKQQRRNSRQNTLLTYNGRTMCLVEWSEELGMTAETLIYRLRNWSLDRAMTQPVEARKEHRRLIQPDTAFQFNGESLTLTQWAAKLGVPYKRLWSRITKSGWSIEQALSTPSRNRH